MARRGVATFLQERMLSLAEDGMDHDISLCVWRVTGPLERAGCERIVRELAERHTALRTSLHAGGGRVEQVVHDDAPFPVAWIRRRGVALDALIRAEARRPVELAAAPWGSLLVVERGPCDHVLVWRFGHAGWDAFSAGVLAREFSRLRAGDPPATPPADLLAHAAGERAASPSPASVAHWRGALRDRRAPAGPPAYEGTVLRADPIAPADERRLVAWAREEGATLPMAVLALLASALGPEEHGRLFGMFHANRSRPGLADAVGCVADLLLVPAPPSVGLDATAMLRGMRDAVFAAYDHRVGVERQLALLPGWRPGGVRFAEALVNVHARSAPGAIGGLRPLACAPRRLVRARGPWMGSDLVLNVVPQPAGGLGVSWAYNRLAWRREAVGRLAGRMAGLIADRSLAKLNSIPERDIFEEI